MAKRKRSGDSVQQNQLQIQKTNDGIKATGIDPTIKAVINISTRNGYDFDYRVIKESLGDAIRKIVSEVWRLIDKFPGEATVTCQNGVLVVSYASSRFDSDRKQFAQALARNVKTHIRTGF